MIVGLIAVLVSPSSTALPPVGPPPSEPADTRPLLRRTAPAAAPAPPMAILRRRARRSPVDRSVSVVAMFSLVSGVSFMGYCSCVMTGFTIGWG